MIKINSTESYLLYKSVHIVCVRDQGREVQVEVFDTDVAQVVLSNQLEQREALFGRGAIVFRK